MIDVEFGCVPRVAISGFVQGIVQFFCCHDDISEQQALVRQIRMIEDKPQMSVRRDDSFGFADAVETAMQLTNGVAMFFG